MDDFFTWLFAVAFYVIAVAGMWMTFVKAGRPGWAAIIPIYNFFIMLKITERPTWWLILYFIPFVNFVAWVIVQIDVAKKFAKGTGFGIGLALLPIIFYMILGFGSARYEGRPAGAM